MNILLVAAVLLIGYIVGATPVGVIVVKLLTGQDVRTVGSGRTGGTNVMRAAGFLPGFLTAMLDILKGAVPIWVSRALLPGLPWLDVAAGVMAVIGHNYSIFLRKVTVDPETGVKTRRLGGGAGGATTFGGAIGLWGWSAVIVFPIAVAIYFGIGYASVTTMSIGIIVSILMGVRFGLGLAPWQYILFGVVCFGLQLWALRPNIRRLRNGTERLVGWRAKRLSGKSTADPALQR